MGGRGTRFEGSWRRKVMVVTALSSVTVPGSWLAVAAEINSCFRRV